MARFTPVPLAFHCVEPNANAEGKPPIVFMHGLTGSKENWNNIPQAVANGTGRRVYVIDARNHGDSKWNDVFNFDCNVDDILHFMDYIGAPKAILVGHSMGGITGIKTALREPERIEKLVVEDMYVKKVTQDHLNLVLLYVALANSAIDEVPNGSDEQTSKQFILDYLYSKLPDEMQKGDKLNPSDIQIKQGPDGKFQYKANMPVLEKAVENYETLMAENTGVYNGPASFIYGTLSPFAVGEEKENIRKYFPNAEFVKIENATHNVHNDFPAEFTNSLVKFILKS